MSLENLLKTRQLETHETNTPMIQSLVASVGLDSDKMRLLDTFRVKRNAVFYSGQDMDIAGVKACIAAGEDLLQHVQQWLAENRPDLLS